MALRDLGEHRLKDLAQPEWIFQLEIDGLDRDFPPLNSLETPSNLPASVTPLVGRDADVAAVEQLLGSDDVRMVTITGPGGTGKTRLALAAAERLGDVFRNGLVFVDLTTVTDPSKVAGAIELALDLPTMPDVPAIENVVTQLHDRAVLLVLDNFEHVAAAAGDLASLLAVPGGSRRSSPAAPPSGSPRNGITRCSRCQRTRRSPCSWTGHGPCVRRSTRRAAMSTRSRRSVRGSTTCLWRSSSPRQG